MCCDHVEGGMYIGPEFQLGQVYDGDGGGYGDSVLLYRPVYVTVVNPMLNNTPSSKNKNLVIQDQPKSSKSSSLAGSKLDFQQLQVTLPASMQKELRRSSLVDDSGSEHQDEELSVRTKQLQQHRKSTSGLKRNSRDEGIDFGGRRLSSISEKYKISDSGFGTASSNNTQEKTYI